MKKISLYIFLCCSILILSFTCEQETEFNKLRNYLNSFENKEDVQRLDISGFKVKKFPMELWEFKSIIYLDISDVEVKKIPSQISEFKELKFFIANNTKFYKFPNEFAQLKKITSIVMSDSKLKELPNYIVCFDHLNSIMMPWSNNLKKLPVDFDQFHQLKKFIFCGEKLNSKSKIKYETLKVELNNIQVNYNFVDGMCS